MGLNGEIAHHSGLGAQYLRCHSSAEIAKIQHEGHEGHEEFFEKVFWKNDLRVLRDFVLYFYDGGTKVPPSI
jgi:hypothetical protein